MSEINNEMIRLSDLAATQAADLRAIWCAICKWGQIAEESRDNMSYHAPTIRAMLHDFILPNAPDDRTPTANPQTTTDRHVGVPVHYLVGQALPEVKP
jgi:hypothetical protein